jgi:hypothetical protein
MNTGANTKRINTGANTRRNNTRHSTRRRRHGCWYGRRRLHACLHSTWLHVRTIAAHRKMLRHSWDHPLSLPPL